MNQSAIDLWKEFSKDHPVKDTAYYSAWAFGRTPEMADELLALVLSGEKTGTSGLERSYELENEKRPEVGDYSILLDGRGNAQAVIQTKVVDLLPYNRITELHGYFEGEGERNLAYWRSVHRPFFEAELEEAGESFSEQLKVVYELFEVVYKKA